MPTSSSAPSGKALSGGSLRRWRERAIESVFAMAGVTAVLVLLGIFSTLFTTGIDAFRAHDDQALTAEERAMLTPAEIAEIEAMEGTVPTVGDDFLGDDRWNPSSSIEPRYGIQAMVVSTFMTALGALLIAAPLGVGVAAWLATAAPMWVREWVKPLIELLAAIPSVVVGFIGIVVIGPGIARVFGTSNGLNAINGSLLLALMALPTIVSMAEDALTAVPRSYRDASLALGADRWQTLVRVSLPAALSGIVAAVMLGLGRAIGETMTVLMATGNALQMPNSWLDPVRTMAATVAIELGEVPRDTTHFRMLFAVGLVLFVITFLVNLVADVFQRRHVEGGG